MTCELLDGALSYAAGGWHVFPTCGEVPAMQGGEDGHDGTTDVDQVRNSRTRIPDANIGARTGASGLAVGSDGPGGLAEYDEVTAKQGLRRRAEDVCRRFGEADHA